MFPFWEEAFTDHDIWFLNVQARSFFDAKMTLAARIILCFAYYIQELFKAVPADKRDKLQWAGPQEDYSWAQPKRGDELTP